MKITICGSIAFIEKMMTTKKALELLGHEAMMPPTEIEDKDGKLIPVSQYYEMRKNNFAGNDWVWQRKKEAAIDHLNKVAKADGILVLNCDKNGIKGYIGGNTLLEMGLAFYLDKKIFLLNPIPNLPYKEEIVMMDPVVINNNLALI